MTNRSTSVFGPVSSSRPGRAVLVGLLAGGVLFSQAHAQQGSVPPRVLGTTRVPRIADEFVQSQDYLVDLLPPVASAIVPGTGQLIRGQGRAAIYLVAEAYLLNRFVRAARRANRERDTFLDLAFSVARAAFSPSIRDTTFEYFEQMGKFTASGPFDANPAPGIQPPTDAGTFNGSIWALALRTFVPASDSVPDPASQSYQRALDFYRSRAIGANFTWSWAGAEFEQDAFREAIGRRNDAFQRRTTTLGFLLANHLLSALDAFVSPRLSTGGGVSLRTGLSTDPRSIGPRFWWSVAVYH